MHIAATAPVKYVFVFLSLFTFVVTMPLSSVPFSVALHRLRIFPAFPQALGVKYLQSTLEKTRLNSHIVFLRQCVRHRVIPNGFRLNFHATQQTSRPLEKILRNTSFRLMTETIRAYVSRTEIVGRQIHTCRQQMSALLPDPTCVKIVDIVKDANRALHNSMLKTKEGKWAKLVPSQNPLQPTHPTSAPVQTDEKLVVTIPDDLPLPIEQKQILSRGLKFIPLKPQVNFLSTLYHCQRFYRRLRLAAHFSNARLPTDKPTDDDDIAQLFPREKSSWTPPAGEFASLDFYICRCKQEINKLHLKPLQHSNITTEELRALRQLQARDDVVIKPADKGGAIVVWRRDLYEAEVRKQLSDTTFYAQQRKSTVKEDNALVRKTIKEAIRENNLPPEASRAIVQEPRESRFYLLPKIHKVNNPGRPIVSACSCPTTLISQFLDALFQPLVTELPTYVKDTNDALRLFNDFTFPDDNIDNRRLFTMDITALYTNIPHNEGLQALKFFLNKSKFNVNHTTILRLAELVLTLNSFAYSDEHYNQTRGVAMGTKMGPSYACLFVGYVEHQIFRAYTGVVPVFFKRFIDDVAGIATCPEADLMQFIDFVSTFHPALRYTHTISDTSLSFLDIKLTITQSTQLSTSVFYKETDSHSYLTYPSSHPTTTKDSIPYSQFLRLRRLCSDDDDFRAQAASMATFFRSRGYPANIVEAAQQRASGVTRREALEPSRTDESNEDRTILVLTYHPHNIAIKNILMKNFNIIQDDPDLRQIFPKPPLVAYKRDTSLRDHLVHTTHRQAMNTQPGNSPCRQLGCKTCPFIDTTLTFDGPSGKSFTVRSSFTCQSTNLVYIIRCTLCGKLYVGETYRTLNERTKEHVSAINLGRDTPVGNHFRSHGHSVQHFRVAGVHQNYTDGVHRRFLEASLITRLGTQQPDGLNLRLINH
jgi:hypothetical protein